MKGFYSLYYFIFNSAKYLLCLLFIKNKTYWLVASINYMYDKFMISQRFIILASDPALLQLKEALTCFRDNRMKPCAYKQK